MPRAPKLSATPFSDAPAPVDPALPVVADPMDLVAEVAEPAQAEFISLAPEVTTESISRLLMNDKPLGFEDMALEAQGKFEDNMLAPAGTPPIAAEIMPSEGSPGGGSLWKPDQTTNENGISLTLLARTIAEQETGREAVARRTADSVRNREITARENAKRQGEGSAAEAGDLSYNERG